jgi:hypothetical protein
MALLARALGLALALAAGAALGCFSPKKPECAFSCVADGVCPTDYHCREDGLCHRDDGQGTCTLAPQIDAGADRSDASSQDADQDDGSAPPDGQLDGAPTDSSAGAS